MSRKDTIDSFFVRKSEPRSSGVPADKDRVRTGAISAMGAQLKELTDGAHAATVLEAKIQAGDFVVELDPTNLDASLVKDRLTAQVDPSFDALVESMRVSGQQVPILVRPHPQDSKRHQIAYGHRRVCAALQLGTTIKAIVRPLDDAELVVAQGKENLDRRDLSYIEKALFAQRLEDQGFDRSVIMAALSTDKADLSRYIALARAMPSSVIEAIGPAYKIGRQRWVSFSEKLSAPGGSKVADAALKDQVFSGLESEGRFNFLFNELAKAQQKSQSTSSSAPTQKCSKAGKIEYRTDRTILTIDEKATPNFGSFLAARLDHLYEQFLQSQQEEGGAEHNNQADNGI